MAQRLHERESKDAQSYQEKDVAEALKKLRNFKQEGET